MYTLFKDTNNFKNGMIRFNYLFSLNMKIKRVTLPSMCLFSFHNVKTQRLHRTNSELINLLIL